MTHNRSITLIALLLMLCINGFSQTRDIPFNGTLTDFNGKIIKKARLYTTSPKNYVSCTKAGAFGLTNVDPSDTLKISVGDNIYSVSIGGRRSLVVKLDIATGQINARENEELRVLGFDHHCQREKGLGAIISGETVRRTGRNDLLSALKGRVPGLSISTVDGDPTNNEMAMIRNARSFHSDSSPVFVVDGVVTESLDGVSVYDVDYVKVVKEASIYGVKGANGAIVVYTRQP